MAVDNHSRIIVPHSGFDKPRDSQAQQDIKDVTTHSVRHCHVAVTWESEKKLINVYAETLVYMSSIPLISRRSRYSSFPPFFFSSFFSSSEQRLPYILIGCIFYVMVLIYLYHAIERTANQNTRKQLYTRRYYTQPSNRALLFFFFFRLFVFSVGYGKVTSKLKVSAKR